MKEPIKYLTRYSREVVERKQVWDKEDQRFYIDWVYGPVPYYVPVYRFGAYYKRYIQKRGPYRIGTSYRRNAAHQKKQENNQNILFWKKSRRDWRHSGSHHVCSGCDHCRSADSLYRGAARARIRDKIKSYLKNGSEDVLF